MPDFALADQAGANLRLHDELERGAVVLAFYRADWWPYCNGQLVELARRYGELRAAGAELLAISVDPVGANAAMSEKLALPFPVLSDPDGDGAVRPNGLWDDDDAVSRVATIVVAPDGREVFRYVGVDYADRATEDEVLAAVQALGLAPRQPRACVHAHVQAEPSEGAETRAELAVYLRGVRSSSKALYERTGDPHAQRVWQMAARYHAALAGS